MAIIDLICSSTFPVFHGYGRACPPLRTPTAAQLIEFQTEAVPPCCVAMIYNKSRQHCRPIWRCYSIKWINGSKFTIGCCDLKRGMKQDDIQCEGRGKQCKPLNIYATNLSPGPTEHIIRGPFWVRSVMTVICHVLSPLSVLNPLTIVKQKMNSGWRFWGLSRPCMWTCLRRSDTVYFGTCLTIYLVSHPRTLWSSDTENMACHKI
jgi:hypothetical protein